MNNNNMEMLNGEFQDNEKVIRVLKNMDFSLIVGYQTLIAVYTLHYTFKNKTSFTIWAIQIKCNSMRLTIIQNTSMRKEKTSC